MPVRIAVLPDAAARVAEEAAAAGTNETGGLLLGWRRSDLGVWAVASATGPGRSAVFTPRSLRLDTTDLQQEVDRWFATTDGEVSYLGDWHLHHSPDPVPSPTDRMSAREIADSRLIGVPDPLMIIIGRTNRGLRWRAWVGARLVPAVVELVRR